MRFIPSIFMMLVILAACTQQNQSEGELATDITPSDIESHINYLAQDTLRGRQAGTPGEAMAARYIADHFRQFGLEPLGEDSTYYQQFSVNMARLNNPHRSDTVSRPGEERIAKNVIGVVRGIGQPNEYIIIGAHYDHLGMGEFGSLYTRDDLQIHNGADDNASGTSGLLELAQYFAQHRPQKSIVFMAFSGEEMGLLGSQHFVENPTLSLQNVHAMINMDMIGRLSENKLIIMGTGTTDRWQTLIDEANTDSLDIQTQPGGTGASDHTTFYNKQIPVLHYFTDTHSDYHRPSDDTQYINFEGEDRVLEHIKQLVLSLDTLPQNQLAFTEAPGSQQQTMTLDGPTMGVTPDYGFDGTGMRITGVRSEGPADRAGLQSGDVIIRLNDHEIKDIYAYMDVLNTLEKGQQTTVTVLRNEQEQTLDITF